MANFQDAAVRKAALIAQAKARTAKPDALAKKESKEYIKPEQADSRLRIVFDNSGSMAGSKITDAKKGVVEFLRNCTPNKDAVAIHLLENPSNYEREDEYEINLARNVSLNILNSVLMTDLTMLASNIDHESITAFAGTPLFECIIRTVETQPQATRIIAFSDGSPNFNDVPNEKTALATAIEAKIPIDTVYFGPAGTAGAETMKRIAEKTGGIFLVFDPAKGVNFADALKYLSPVQRLRLMDEKFKADLQAGRVK